MEKNVGTLDSYLRITGGLMLLGYGIRKSSNLAMLLGAMKVAEGVTRWCPMLYYMGKSTLNTNENSFDKVIKGLKEIGEDIQI